jgi:hypothetical protein
MPVSAALLVSATGATPGNSANNFTRCVADEFDKIIQYAEYIMVVL